MQAESIIAALIGAAFGGGGLRLAYRFFGPQHESEVVKYYRRVLKSVMEENEHQRERIKELLVEAEHTTDRLHELEDAITGDLPPEYS